MQTAMLFALRLGLVEGVAKERTVAALRDSIAAEGGTLHTGFLGTAIALDTLTESHWRYEGDTWIWEFSIPDGATASVTLPGETVARTYGPGSHRLGR